jgi:SAM-dependent methyltransferase
MKYYYREHLAGYHQMRSEGKRSWGEVQGHPDDFENFSSRNFLEKVLPRLRFENDEPRALELGCGTGPGACLLAQRGFRVDGIDLIPTAIEVAREMAEGRHLNVHYEVMDVTEIPHTGIKYDLIVDSYCLQGVVLEPDRKKVFSAVRARLKPSGYYLISTAMYAEHRHHPEDRIVDPTSGRVFHRYDDHDLFDPDTDIFYSLFSGAGLSQLDDQPEDYGESIRLEGKWYLPTRRYKSPQGLRVELEYEGFRVLLQTGEYGENVVCALHGASVSLDDRVLG